MDKTSMFVGCRVTSQFKLAQCCGNCRWVEYECAGEDMSALIYACDSFGDKPTRAMTPETTAAYEKWWKKHQVPPTGTCVHFEMREDLEVVPMKETD
jgi:hypothetical protein